MDAIRRAFRHAFDFVRRGPAAAALLLGALLLACGGGGGGSTGTGPAPAAVHVSISPATLSMQAGGTQAFTATVTGASNTAVSWTATAGSITADGHFTAPATAGGCTVRATSAADASKWAEATVTVTAVPLPSITQFTASPTTITSGQSSALAWTVTGATSLTLDPGNQDVTGQTGVSVSPSATTTYTLTAHNAGGSVQAQAAVTVSGVGPTPTDHVEAIYDGTFHDKWGRVAWEDGAHPVFTDTAAAAPGRTGHAIEVRFGASNGWNAIGFADRVDWNDMHWKYLNEYRTLGFDLYIEPDATGMENLEFVLEDAGHANYPKLVQMIPGWAAMTADQKVGHWHHIAVDLHDPSVNIYRFESFLIFNGAGGDVSQPHFRLANLSLGWTDDTTAPVMHVDGADLNLTYDQLTLRFSSNEATTWRVEYGVGAYDHTLEGAADDLGMAHTAVLAGLTPGTHLQYRVVGLDHRTDPLASPNQGKAEATYDLPAVPTAPPVISGLAASGIEGHKAGLAWSTNRPCTATVTYQKSGGAAMSRTLTDYAAARTFTLDLLEASSAYHVVLQVKDAFNLTASQALDLSTTATSTADVTVTADPASTRPISPYIYGSNQDLGLPQFTMGRLGGNSWSTYNWENNANNAGEDWYNWNYDYLPWIYDVPGGEYKVPGRAVLGGLDKIFGPQSTAQAALITVPLQGYVAADAGTTDGFPEQDVSLWPDYLNTRFKKVKHVKGSAFTTTPDTADGFVYTDEFVNWVKTVAQPRYAGKTIFFSLDNEPDLWHSTHDKLQLQGLSYDTLCQKNEDAAKAVKSVLPNATVFGFVSYGWYGYTYLQGAPDGSGSDHDAKGDFTDYWLEWMKAAEGRAGKRVVDVLDLHYYTSAESPDGSTAAGSGDLSDAAVKVRVQSARSLWDPTYVEDSWITRDGLPDGDKAIRLIPRMMAKIAAHYPGTKLAITEYNYGGGEHVSGGIAQADALGAYGREGVFAATRWAMNWEGPFSLGAFKAYRNFNGAGGDFGDVSIRAASSNVARVMAYVSKDSAHPGRYVLVLINRHTADQDVTLGGLALSGTAKVYRIDRDHPEPAFAGQVPVSGGSWTVNLPAMSVSTVEIW